MLSRAALVIALSPTWERRLTALTACRTTAVNPVPIPPDAAPRQASPAPIVCLGRLGVRKGSKTMVRALAILSETASRRHDSSSPVTATSRRCAPKHSASRLSDRVELPGWVGPDECRRILLAATVFALPSRDEGLPVALLEAMAYGLPAVVSPVGGIPDAFHEGRHGYFVAPDDPVALADRIAALVEDPKGAGTMGNQARHDARERYATEVVAEQVGDALASVLARGRVD